VNRVAAATALASPTPAHAADRAAVANPGDGRLSVTDKHCSELPFVFEVTACGRNVVKRKSTIDDRLQPVRRDRLPMTTKRSVARALRITLRSIVGCPGAGPPGQADLTLDSGRHARLLEAPCAAHLDHMIGAPAASQFTQRHCLGSQSGGAR